MKYNIIFSPLLWLLCFVLVWPSDSALAQVAPPQQSSVFTGKDAQTVIAEALAKAGAGEDINVSIAQTHDEDVIASGTGIIAAETDGLQVDKAHSQWQAVLLLKADGKNLAPVKLSGRFEEMTRIPVLKTNVQASEVIAEGDIDWDRQPAQHLRKNTITDARDLIGKSPRHTLSAGRPIRTDEIAGPAIVSKGAQVTLFYKSHNIEIRTFGEALEPGSKGEVIRVRNITSKAVIQGTVEANGNVLVTSPDSDSAEAM